jgi:hypothetical protein
MFGLTQNQLLELILRGTGMEITAREARQLGIANLSARMSEFRQKNLKVTTGKNENGETTYRVSRRTTTFGDTWQKF